MTMRMGATRKIRIIIIIIIMKKENYNLQCVSALGFLLAGFLSFPSFADVEREKKIMIKKCCTVE